MSDLLLDILVDILGEPKNLNTSTNQYQFNCPICSAEKGVMYDNKFNLEVNLEKNVYHCWSCIETHGSIKRLVGLWGTRDQKRRIKILLPEEQIITSEDSKTVFEGLPKEYISLSSKYDSELKRKAIWYIKKRGLTDYHIEKFKIGFAEKGQYSGRIIIPSHNKENNIDYFITRTFTKQKPKYLNSKSEKSGIIFNEIFLSWYSTIYFVEGPFDHLVVPNSIPGLGKIMSDEVLKKIHDNAMADIVILQDGDAWKDSIELYSKLNCGKLTNRVKIIKLPEEYDISLIHEKFGNEGIIKILKNSFKLKEHLI